MLDLVVAEVKESEMVQSGMVAMLAGFSLEVGDWAPTALHYLLETFLINHVANALHLAVAAGEFLHRLWYKLKINEWYLILRYVQLNEIGGKARQCFRETSEIIVGDIELC